MTAVTPDLGVRPGGGGAGRALLLVFGSLAALIGAAILAGGAAMLWLDRTQRDETGYLNTSTGQILTRSYALTSDPFELDLGDARSWVVDEDVVGKLRLRAESADSDVGIFVGIARAAAVERYLAGVEADRVAELDVRPFRTELVRLPGGPPPTAPADQAFWAASASGPGEQTLTWEAESGEWTIVAMNEDGSAGIDVRVQAGAQLGLLDWLGAALAAVGLLVLGAGVTMIVVGARSPTEGGGAAVAAPPALVEGERAYPV